MGQIWIPSKQAIRKARCEKNFEEYMKDAWKILEPNNPFQYNWHIGAIAEYLMAVEYGQITRTLINIPPRFLKSMEVTVMYPSWSWIKNPHKKFANMSYAADLAIGHNVLRRDLIESHWYQQNWGDKITLRNDKNTKKDYWNTATGEMYATSVDGQITGKGFDCLIFDDPHNPKQAESDTQRKTAIDFFRGTIQSRLNDLKTGSIIVVMQRLHEMDLSGYILASDLGYEHLCLPAEAPVKVVITLPISKKEIVREDGDLLFPERFPKDILKNLEKNLGSYSYSGQYQQEPAPRGGGILKSHWFRYWKPKGMELPPVEMKYVDEEGKTKTLLIHAVDLPEDMDEHAQSWDAAFKKSEESDYVAGGVWSKRKANKYFIDLDKQKRTFTETLTAIRNMSFKHPKATRKLIEDKANGPAIIDVLKNEVTGIIPINPGSDSKVARVEAIAPQIESGNVYLPHPMIATWVEDFVLNCSKFPKVEHDRQSLSCINSVNCWEPLRAA